MLHATIARMAGHFTREDVERIARLARLELTEHEKDAPHAAAVELPRLRRTGAAGRDRRRSANVAPARHLGAWRDDTPHPSLDRADAAVAGAGSGRRARTLQSTTSPRMTHAFETAGAIAARGAIRSHVGRRGVPGGAGPHRRRQSGAQRLSHRRRASRRSRRPRRSIAGATTGRGLPLLGVPVALKDNLCTRGLTTTAGSRILEHYVPPYNATAVERLDRRRRRHRRQDQLRRVRDGIVDRELGVRPDAQSRGRSTGRPAARAADRRPRSPRAWCRSRSAPTPAAPSASPPRSAASSASSRPTAASRATACSPSRRHSIRLAHSRPRSPTPRSRCGVDGRARIRKTRRARRPPPDVTSTRSPVGSLACGSACRARSSPKTPACDPEFRIGVRTGGRDAAGSRAPRSSTSRCRTARTPSRSTTLSPPRRRARTSRATTAFDMDSRAWSGDARRDVRPHPRRGLRPGGQAPNPARHLRPQRRATTTPTTSRRSRCAR